MSSKSERYSRELLGRLTLREKVAQLSQTVAGYRSFSREGEKFTFQPEFYKFIAEYGAMGAISNILRADHFAVKKPSEGIEPRHRVKVANQLQREILKHARVPIPALIEVEANHGVMALGSEVFPTNLGLGCMFNDGLYEQIMKSVGKEVELSANHVGFTTMLDMARDPRWGRTEEFFSEDPYLAARYAESGVVGFKKAHALLCCKHYCATGDGLGGLNTAEVNIGKRELHDIHLLATKKAVWAGADMMMAAYNTVDGVPCHLNRYLLQDVLRCELGFLGIVLSDGWGVARAIEQMGMDAPKGAAEALRAGIDLSLADHGAYLSLIEACEQGLVDESLIDAAVLRILQKKFELGLFDDPYRKEDGSLVAYLDSEEQKRLSYKAASESVVLLKNNGILPLDRNQTVGLFGCHADNLYYLLGDYTALQSDPSQNTLRTVFEKGFKELKYSKGWDFCGDSTDIAHAVELAKSCDVAVITVGGSSARGLAEAAYDNRTGAVMQSDFFLDCGEGCDVASLRLPGNQSELIRRIKEAGVSVVLLMIAGRPYAIGEESALADGVMAVWYPGAQGAQAVFDILVGDQNPCGKLSVSIPTSDGCLPVYYNRYQQPPQVAKKKAYNKTYMDCLKPVLYPFGYGLSYSEFAYSDLSVIELAPNRLRVDVTVSNVSAVAGQEVVQLYIHGSGNSVRRREKELKGYQKIALAPGEKKTVTFLLGAEELSVYTADEHYAVEDATVQIMVGSNPHLPLTAQVRTHKEVL